MDFEPINWGEVYETLDIPFVKYAGKWMLTITVIIGLLIILAIYFLSKKNIIVLIIFGIGVILFSGRYLWGLFQLNKKPTVYYGNVINKSILKRSDNSTYSQYEDHFIEIAVFKLFKIDSNGINGEIDTLKKNYKFACSSSIYESVAIKDTISALVMPHDNTIYRIFFNNNRLKN